MRVVVVSGSNIANSRVIPPSTGASITTEASATPSAGRASLWISTMNAHGRSDATDGGTGTPSKRRGTSATVDELDGVATSGTVEVAAASVENSRVRPVRIAWTRRPKKQIASTPPIPSRARRRRDVGREPVGWERMGPV